MNWLIWKDYRINRVLVIVAVALFVVPHAIALIAVLRGTGARMWQWNFGASGVYSLVFLQAILAVMGGNAIAGERVDRSAEFLASLPVSRGRKLVSKLLVSLAMFAWVWIPNLVILALIALGERSAIGPADIRQFLEILGNCAVTGITFYCVAWCLSSMLESPTYSASGGLAVPALVIGGIAWVAYLCQWDDTAAATIAWLYCAICLTISAICFLGGTVYYLRRVEP